MKPVFKIYKYYRCCQLMATHKRIFRTYYNQSWHITDKDIKDIRKQEKRFSKYDDFRPYVKHYKPIIKRAYNIYGGVKLKYLSKLAANLSTDLYAPYC